MTNFVSQNYSNPKFPLASAALSGLPLPNPYRGVDFEALAGAMDKHDHSSTYGAATLGQNTKVVTSQFYPISGGNASIPISNAIVDLQATGGVVVLPPGTYTIKSLLQDLNAFYFGITIQGAGMGNTILVVDPTFPAGAPLFGGIAGVQLTFRDLTVIGKAAITGWDPTGGERFVDASSCNRVTVERCELTQFGGSAVIEVQSSNRVVVRWCDIHDNQGEGVLLAGNTTDSDVSHNDIYNNGDNGIDFNGSYNNCSHNRVHDNGLFINLPAWPLNGRSGYGITCEGDGPSAPIHNVFDGNVVKNNPQGGINCSVDATVGKVCGRHVISNNTVTYNGIGGVKGLVGGHVYHVQGMGIQLGGTNPTYLEECVVTGNIVAFNGEAGDDFPVGVHLDWTRNGVVTGNVIANNSDVGLRATVNVPNMLTFPNIYTGNGSGDTAGLPGGAPNTLVAGFSMIDNATLAGTPISDARLDMTLGTLVLNGLTTTQRAALAALDRRIAYDTTIGRPMARAGGVWSPILPPAPVLKSANYAMVAETDGVLMARGSGTTITLPNAPPGGYTCTVQRFDFGGAFNIVVQRAGGDNILLNGSVQNSVSLNTNGASVTMTYWSGTYVVTASLGTVV